MHRVSQKKAGISAKMQMHKILHLSCKINCYKVKLVHNHQLLIVPEDISVKGRSIFWGEILFLATFAFLVE